MSQVKFR